MIERRNVTGGLRDERRLIPTLLSLLFCAALGSYLCAYLSDPQIFFDITVGNWIVTHRSLPIEDLWSAALVGKQWIARNWLYQALVSVIESRFGWEGLTMLKMALCVGTVLSTFRFFSSVSRDPFFAGLAAVLCCCGMLEQAPLSETLLVFCLLPFLLRVFSNRVRQREIVSVFVIATVLSNVSPAWLIFAALLGVAVAHDKRVLGAFIVAAVCSPYLGKQLLAAARDIFSYTAFNVSTGALATGIYDFPLAFLLLIWCLLLLLARGAGIDLKRRESAAAAVTSLFGIFFSPLLPVALLLTGWSLCIVWAQRGERAIPLSTAIEGIRGFLFRLPATGSAWVLFCISVVNIVNAYRISLIDVFLPVKELDFVVENRLPEPIWHEAAIGPYVAYRFSDASGHPFRRNRIDNRAITVSHRTLVEDYREEWQPAFQSESPRTVLVRSNSELFSSLSENGQFRRIDLPDNHSDDPEHTPARKTALFWALFVRAFE